MSVLVIYVAIWVSNRFFSFLLNFSHRVDESSSTNGGTEFLVKKEINLE